MKSSEQDKLLKELLPDERLAHFRETSLERSLVTLRRHRRQRFLFRAGALAAMACLVVCGLLLKDRNPIHNTRVAVSLRRTPEPEHVKFISDDELLAMFPQGSVALVGKPGEQRLVLLDAPQSRTPQAREPGSED